MPALAQSVKAEMLLYCGITMVKPMTEIAQIFEKRENVKILVAQGGSEDLYQSAKKTGVGDWYLPGEPSYRDKHLNEGLFGEFVTVGYNQMAMIVQKGNPKKVKADPREMLRKDLVVIIGNAESGSVGQEAKKVLDDAGIVVCRQHDHGEEGEPLRNVCEQAQATGFGQLDIHQHQVDFGMLLQPTPE